MLRAWRDASTPTGVRQSASESEESAWRRRSMWMGTRRGGRATIEPQSKRQPVVELPRLRLPLPERTGSDRDELHCPHGFVDRAYLVFLLRCVATNLTHLGLLDCRLDLRPSPLFHFGPEASPHERAVQSLRIETRVRAPRVPEAPVDNWMLHHACDGGPEDRAPMEVPDLRAALPNS